MSAKPEAKGAASALFFRHWLRRPLEIGAILPSTPAVGRALARAVHFDRAGAILELGAGTGVVTQALLDAGCDPERLIVIEREKALAAVLRARFGGCRIVEGDACAIEAILRDLGVTELAGVVSCLPIKWFPVDSQRAVIRPCLDLAGADGSFLQMTNALVSPVAMAPLGLVGEEITRIWAQFPPVQIWRYRRAEDKVAAA